jgi:hypothetical protein
MKFPATLRRSRGPKVGFMEQDSREDREPAQAFNAAVQRLRQDHLSVFWGDRLLTLDKSAGFLNDPDFVAAIQSIRGSHVYDQYDGADSIAWRLHTLLWAAEQSLNVEGDFIECGTFKGDMAFVIAKRLGRRLSDRTFRLFDSFAGLSPRLARADDYPDNPGFIDFANQYYRQEGLLDSVRDRFRSMPHVEIVQGFLPESLAGKTPDHIAFLHIDLNSPKAEVACLEQLFDRVSPGGIIVLDDYGWRAFRMQKQGEDAFFRDHGYLVLELPTGQGLVVKR